MKMVRCVMSPNKLEALKKVLWSSGFQGITVTESQGLGSEKSGSGGADGHMANFSPRINVEVAVENNQLEKLLGIMLDTVRTGRVGDGKIFVTQLDQVIRVRTGERGETAI